jgi:phage baseplate assembly protein W
MSEEKGIVFYDKNFISFSGNQDELIKENVKRILMTRRGERINNLSFGSDLLKYLFMPDMHINDIITEIKNSVERNEPRCTVESCSLSSYENETVNVDLKIKSKITGTVSDVSINV